MARQKMVEGLGVLLLLVVTLAVYANHFHNGFHFDDAHTIENNAALRELRNIPLFFRDAGTFSALPSNQSYRPLVSTLLTISYSLGHGLHPFWFHCAIFSLFLLLLLLLMIMIDQFLDDGTDRGRYGRQVRTGGTPVPDARDGRAPRNWWIAILAAAAYGLHPANADTVNYIIASAEVISTLGVVTSFALYFAFPKWRRFYLFVLPAAVCILAKPPAAIFAVLFAIYRGLFPCSLAPASHETLHKSAATKAWLMEVIPPFVICGALVWFVQHMTPNTWVAGATSAHDYLITQPYVILQYVKTFFWPSGLSADYDLNPFKTTDDARFWLGFLFTFFFVGATVVLCLFKRTRLIGFGCLWFLVALLPTSLFPLAEVINDHRTFFPYIGLIIALAGLIQLVVLRFPWPGFVGKLALTGAASLLLGGSAYATFQRNKVWATEETLWRDVTHKSPGNARGLMNYGITLMAKGNYAGALDYLHRAQVLAPRYSFLMINLAIAEDATKQTGLAEQHFHEALQLAPALPDAYSYYARFLLGQSRVTEARSLLEKAQKLSPTDQTVRDLLAQAERPTAEGYLQLSMQRYGEGRFAESIAAAEQAVHLRPGYAEAWNNIGASYNKVGQFEKGAAVLEEALRLKPDFELARNNLQYARDMMKENAGKK